MEIAKLDSFVPQAIRRFLPFAAFGDNIQLTKHWEACG